MIVDTLEKELNLADWQVKKVIKLIDDGNTCHLQCAYLTDHNVVKHTYEVCDTVLNHYGNCNNKHSFVVGQRIFDILFHLLLLILYEALVILN
jgi:hypothetical protein